MEYLELLSLGQNEIDVVATFNSAYPKIIVKLGDVNFVAYDSVAFLAEIKTTLDKTNLTEDLIKFEKISGLPLSENMIRMGGGFVGVNYVIERPEDTILFCQCISLKVCFFAAELGPEILLES